MAISDVLRKALYKLSFSHLNGDIGDPGNSKAQISGIDMYDRDDCISHTPSHSHTFNTYSPNIETTPKRIFRFPLSTKKRDQENYSDENEDIDVVHRAKMRLERAREKGREKKEKEKLKSAKKKKPKRLPQCRMQSLESFSWASGTGSGTMSAAGYRDEESDNISPMNTRNNSRANQMHERDERMQAQNCTEFHGDEAQFRAELARLLL